MIKWYDSLYFDEKIAKNPSKAKKRVASDRIWGKGYYVIALAQNGVDLFDIIPSWELLFRHYKRTALHVVGLAKTKETAIQLVQQIVDDQVNKGITSSLRQSFSENQFQEWSKGRVWH